MKVVRKPLEVFTLSFLDIISCAFGAIVMLVLLAKNGDKAQHTDVTDMAAMLINIAQMQNENGQLGEALAKTSSELTQLLGENKTALIEQRRLEAKLKRAKDNVTALNASAEALAMVEKSQIRAATRVNTTKKRVEEVGGIPVDSEYVVFIVDTSGSMRSVWPRLLQEMEKILDIHPTVKGFQVMNDMGKYLLSSGKGQWLKDTPKIRQTVLNKMKNWNVFSNSSPVEGLEVALQTYAKAGSSLSIYILGDEYNGGSYDPVIESLNRLNTDKKSGKRIARVHAIGFVSGARTAMFSTLMREVTKQNRGTYLALPL